MSRFLRLAHFKELSVKEGDWIEAGKTEIGIPGNTGHSFGVHVHMDGTNSHPYSWHQYKNRSISEYFDPEEFAKNVLPYEGMYLTNRHRRKGHIGVDINCPDDAHKTAFAPATGRVVYVEPSVIVKKKIKGVLTEIDRTYGQGFGKFLWMQIDESKYEKQ